MATDRDLPPPPTQPASGGGAEPDEAGWHDSFVAISAVVRRVGENVAFSVAEPPPVPPEPLQRMRFVVHDGGQGEYHLEFAVPPNAPRDAVLGALADVYSAEKLPEWRLSSFLATAAATLDEHAARSRAADKQPTLREKLAAHSKQAIRDSISLLGRWADRTINGADEKGRGGGGGIGALAAGARGEAGDGGGMLEMFVSCMRHGGSSRDGLLEALRSSRAEGLKLSAERAAEREKQVRFPRW